MGKKLQSPDGGENATPDRVKVAKLAPIGGKASAGKPMRSSGDIVKGRLQYSSPTPDLRGNLFNHKRNDRGV